MRIPAVASSWRVRDLARHSGVTVRTLHHYEAIGLPARLRADGRRPPSLRRASPGARRQIRRASAEIRTFVADLNIVRDSAHPSSRRIDGHGRISAHPPLVDTQDPVVLAENQITRDVVCSVSACHDNDAWHCLPPMSRPNGMFEGGGQRKLSRQGVVITAWLSVLNSNRRKSMHKPPDDGGYRRRAIRPRVARQ
jgi:hypothetical protein